MTTIAIIPSLIALFIVGGGIALAIRVLFFSQPRLPEGPVCGLCGYAVKGAVEFRCPECGEDYRHVGIVSSKARTRPHIVFLILAWTFVMLMLGGVGSWSLKYFIPVQAYADLSEVYESPEGALHFELICESSRLFWPGWLGRRSTEAPTANGLSTLILSGPQGRAIRITVNAAKGRGELRGADETRRDLKAAPTATEIQDELANLNLTTDPAQTEALAQALSIGLSNLMAGTFTPDARSDLRSFSTGPGFTSSSWTGRYPSSQFPGFTAVRGRTSKDAEPHSGGLVVAGLIWFTLWVLGMKLFVWKARE